MITITGNVVIVISPKSASHLDIDVLIETGKASLHVYNGDNQNPLDIAFHYKHLPFINAIQKCLQSQDKSTIFKRLIKNPVFA